MMSIVAALALGTADPCRDERMRDLCSAAEQQRMRKLYRVEPISVFAGGTSRRLFYVDGYGNDVIAVEFLRLPGNDPKVRVHFPSDTSGKPTPHLEALLTSSQWKSVIEASLYFDQKFASDRPIKAGKKDEIITLCIHGWSYSAEATDPGKPARRVTDSACNDSPVEQFAGMAAKIAREAFPHCSLLNPEFSRNEVTLLGSCAELVGDRLAAAAVLNRAEFFRHIDSPEAYGGIARMADWSVKLDNNGQLIERRDAVAAWKSLFTGKRRASFYYSLINGIDEATVIVSGSLYVYGEDGRISQSADVEMRWEKEANRFDLEKVKIGPFRPNPGVNE